MEPMTLGSASSSPASPGVNSSGFLPNFLIGDITPSTPYHPHVSPGRNKTPGSFRGNSTMSEAKTLRQKLFSQSMAESPIQPPPSPFTSAPEKTGPPKTGLFDTLDSAKKVTSPVLSSTVAPYNEPSMFINESLSRIHSVEENSINISNNRGSKIDSQWVTVFGFPPSTLNLVLSQLSNCGVILEKKIPSQGNWMHIKFNNLGEVARALALNGKCIANNIMIGVQLHYNKENKENNSGATMMTSPIRARSLRQSFVSPHASNTVIPAQSMPQKSTGIVSKAMEYVFGW
ncbi:nucleoporin Nup35 [Anthonomus grandis grandis]|uniref:nucleoporin Nup35 n=1 Tax=Anthonomus grandis grandis TaxID=2921223 RepID=UPI0021667BF3|nr:nucleoporin Nup35 [Anthonomus grandis grandis]